MAIGEYLTTRDVANRLGVTPGRVRQFVVEQRLVVANRAGAMLFFRESDVEEFEKIERMTGRPKSEK